MTIKQIISSLGGVSVVRKELNIKYNSLIYGWIYRGVIPSWRINELISLAEKQENYAAIKNLNNLRRTI